MDKKLWILIGVNVFFIGLYITLKLTLSYGSGLYDGVMPFIVLTIVIMVVADLIVGFELLYIRFKRNNRRK